MELFLIRHASSTRAKEGVWGRLYDAPLDEGFESQLAGTKSALQLAYPLRIVSSPLLRCQETATFLFPGSRVRIVYEFRAYGSGDLEDKTEQFIREHHPEYLRLSYRERFLRPIFREESLEDQALRVARGILKILSESRRSTAVIAHFSSLNILAHIALHNWDLEAHGSGTYDIDLGSYIRIVIDPLAVISDVTEHIARSW